ncbi:reverse transcriptase-like protein, partial [Salmonella enterica subsp. enterica serovar Derby]|nr:reverse transcriptase-like protein [Salmonella enterica subsp. enterica serovar Derby]
GSTLSSYFPQEEGVPQGSVLSVTLFILRINDIFRQLPLTVRATGFVDDLQIFCSSVNIGLAERQLQSAISKLSSWTLRNGFVFSSQKTVCVHFCRKRGLHPDPSLRLGPSNIRVVPETKFLGVYLDRALTFRPHVRHLKVQCSHTLNILKVLSGTSWGADRCSLLRIYHSLVRSKLDYGCIVYGSARPSILRLLDPVSHQALRLCTGAFRTSPVHSLYVEAHEPPLSVRRQQLSLRYFLKLRSLPDHPLFASVFSPRFVRLFAHRPSCVPTFGIRMSSLAHDAGIDLSLIGSSQTVGDPPWLPSVVDADFSLCSFPNVSTPDSVYQQLFSEHRLRFSGFTPLFTDGSRSGDVVGSAFVCTDEVVAQRLPSVATVFTAELRAIHLALQHIQSKPHHHAVVYVDSLSALQALCSAVCWEHPMVCATRRLLCLLSSSGFLVQFCWVPGHVGIRGNDLADVAAKSVSSLGVTRHPLFFRDFYSIICSFV